MNNQALDMNQTPDEKVMDETPPSPSDGAKAKPSGEARYAALRNHRIRFEDAIDPDAERVSKLHKTDILFGRGKGFQNHPGNQRMREVIEKYKVQYHSLKRSEKQELIEAVYKELTEEGARFLKKLDNEDAWVKVDRPVALQKVSHTLRCRKNVEKYVCGSGIAKQTGNLSNPSAGQLQGMMSSQAMAGMAVAYNPLMNLGAQRMTPYDSMVGLEAQRMAALERYRALSGMSAGMSAMASPMMAMQPSFDQFSLRREQLLREFAIMQQMQQAVPSMAGLDPTVGLENAASSQQAVASLNRIAMDG
jgi:hypothetical protein